MAKDSSGKKFNRIEEHKRTINGKKVTIPEHVRSNPCPPKGKKKK